MSALGDYAASGSVPTVTEAHPAGQWHRLSDAQRRMLTAVIFAGPEGYRAAPYNKTLAVLERLGRVRKEPIEARVLQVLW